MSTDMQWRDNEVSKYDEMFRERRKLMPHAFDFPFWSVHFCTQSLLSETRAGEIVLDVGCGTGEIDILLARSGRNVVGIDISQEAIDEAVRKCEAEPEAVRQRLAFKRAFAQDLDLPAASFDAIVLSEVFEHLADPRTVVTPLLKALKPSGKLIVLVPNGWNHDDPTHVWHFTPQTLRFALEAYGSGISVETSADGTNLKAIVSKAVPAPGVRVVGMMRVKNEEAWLSKSLGTLTKICDAVVVVDDGSSDGTYEIARSTPEVIHLYRQDAPLDEVRDRQYVLDVALALQPDWVMSLDGDEEIDDENLAKLREAMLTAPTDVDRLDFAFLYLWDNERVYRVDGEYANVRHPRALRCLRAPAGSLSFRSSSQGHEGGLHCGSLPQTCGKILPIDVNVRHYGYLRRADRERKRQWYEERDPVKAAQGYYRHLTDETGIVLKHLAQERPGGSFVWDLLTKQVELGERGANGGYYERPRTDLLDLFTSTPRLVLDVGCGAGATSAELKRRAPSACVIGIESQTSAAGAARNVLDYVIEANAEDLDFSQARIRLAEIDTVLLADVLEHMYNPWRFLMRLRPYLAPGAQIVASIPNARNLWLLSQLASGNFTYEAEGLLDITHIRFFTKREMLKLFEQTGYTIESLRYFADDRLASIPPHVDAPVDVTVGALVLRGLDDAALQELRALQIHALVRPAGG